MRGPDFLIVGAGRAGTTTLYHWLRAHPNVFMPDDKEPGYFVHGYGVSDVRAYERLFEPASGRLAGEATTMYLPSAESPDWIRRELGDIPILITLRDPATRCFSLHTWMYQNGWEPIDVFEDALAAEPERLANPASMARYKQSVSDDYLYFSSCLYSEQVSAYQQRFSAVKVLLLEDLRDDPQGSFDSVCDFLGVGHAPVANPGRSNIGKRPRWPGLQFRIRAAIRRCQDHTWPGNHEVEMALLRATQLNVRLGHEVQISPRTEAELRVRFAPDVQRTAALIGRDLSAWLPRDQEVRETDPSDPMIGGS